MITRFSLKKSFFYLTGLVIACFFHLSCQIETNKLGMNGAGPDVGSASSTSENKDSSKNKDNSFRVLSIEQEAPELQGTCIQEVAYACISYIKKHLHKYWTRYSEEEIHEKCGFTQEGSSCSAGEDDINVSFKENTLVLTTIDGVSRAGLGTMEFVKKVDGHITSSRYKEAKDILNYVHAETLKPLPPNSETGACTVCIIAIDPSGKLTSAKMGNGSYIVVRDGKIVHKPETQLDEKAPNNPCCLLSCSDPNHKLCEHECNNLDNNATFGTFQLQSRDRVISCTDGVWDQYANKQDLVDDILKNLNEEQEKDYTRKNPNKQKKDYIRKNFEDFNAKEITNYILNKIEKIHEGSGPTRGSKIGNKDDASIAVITIK